MRKYWYVYKSWVNNFEELTTFFDYPPEIRKIITQQNQLKIWIDQLESALKIKEVSNN